MSQYFKKTTAGFHFKSFDYTVSHCFLLIRYKMYEKNKLGHYQNGLAKETVTDKEITVI